MRKVKRFCVFYLGSCYYYFNMSKVLEAIESYGLKCDEVSWFIAGGETIIVDCE